MPRSSKDAFVRENVCNGKEGVTNEPNVKVTGARDYPLFFVRASLGSGRLFKEPVGLFAHCGTAMFGLAPRCLINQTRAALAGEIAPEPLVLHAAPVLQLRQEHDVNKRPDEPRNNSCEPDSA